MNHSSELKNLYKKLNTRLQYSKKKSENDPANFYNLPIILKIIFGIPILGVLVTLLSALTITSDPIVIIIILAVCFYFFWVVWWIVLKPILMEIYFSNLANINQLLNTNNRSIENTPLILKKIETIIHLYKYKFYHFLDPKTIPLELQYFILLLTDLRSDLSIRLAEQQSTLESAKSEVEKNITWTTELNQVSELQLARLNRQIEKFEELQRVLVKV